MRKNIKNSIKMIKNCKFLQFLFFVPDFFMARTHTNQGGFYYKIFQKIIKKQNKILIKKLDKQKLNKN